MALGIIYAAWSAFLPKQYLIHIVVFIAVVAVIRAFAQGRTTIRERDLHARVILVTGGFTPLGLTLLQSLAKRGAHIIALSPYPISSPSVAILVDLIRSATSNEQIFAEECDLTSPNSVKDFCTRFLTGKDQRLDALVFAHEYQTMGSIITQTNLEKQRDTNSLATFLIITLLLPALLVAPVERDIRIVNVVNPFYAAAAPSFSPNKSSTPSSLFLLEGRRALQMVVFTRHLQRILDALPAAQVPKTDENSTVPVVSGKSQKSNIVAVSVSPGISRTDTVAPLLSAGRSSANQSLLGFAIYVTLQPVFRIITKSTSSALQSVLHTLFLPTPFKVSLKKSAATLSPTDDDLPEEVLKPGALYSECAVVNLKVPIPPDPELLRKGKEKEAEGNTLEDDGELGGEVAGRLVWEAFETGLKAWEKQNPPKPKEEVKEVDTGVAGHVPT